MAAERLELRRAFGANIAARRKVANLTVTGLAKRCRIPHSTIVKIETGRAGDPSLRIILILCEAFAVTPSALLVGLKAPDERPIR